MSSDAWSEEFYRDRYYRDLSTLASQFVEIYADLFLLWLLYRFMKPQRVLKDGTTEASVLLFAHDCDSAEINLINDF